MKVFVGYGYNERDTWIEEHIFDLIRAFGAEPVSGKEVFGKELEDAVREKIKECDALIGFATRRDRLENGKYTTHRWVTDEIKTANELKMPFVEVREIELDPQLGSVGGRQHIVFDPTCKEKCVVALAVALGQWRLGMLRKLQLLPDDVVRTIRPYLNNKGFSCSYRVLNGNAQSAPINVNVVKMRGGLFAFVPTLQPLALIQITVEADGKAWTSGYEPIDAVGIQLEAV